MRPHVPISLLVVTAAVTIGFGAIFALLPDFQDELGFTDGWLGAVTASSFAAGFVAQVGLARYADRGFGRALLVGGLAVAAVGLVGVAVAEQVGVLLAARLLLGLGEGAFLPAARRVVILRNPDAVGAALGRLGAAAVTGFLAGPPVAAFVADATGLRAPFWLLAAVLVALVPVVARFAVPPVAAAETPRAPVRALLVIPGVRAGLCIGLGLAVAIGVYDSLWAKFLKEDHQASTRFVALSLTIFALPIAVLAPRMGRLADRVGPVRLGAVCTLCSVPFVAAYGYLPNEWVIGVFAFVHSTFDSGATPAGQAAVAAASPPELVAAGQGLYDGAGLLAAAVSSLVAAPLYSRAGAEALWVTLAAAVGLAGAGAWRLGQNTRSASIASRSRRAIARSTARSP